MRMGRQKRGYYAVGCGRMLQVGEKKRGDLTTEGKV